MIFTKCLIFSLFIVICSARFDGSCRKDAYPPKKSTQVPTMVINLDLPAEERWKEVALKYKDKIKALIGDLKSLISEFGIVGKEIIVFIDNYVGNLADTLPDPYKGEIKGLVKYTEINPGEIVLYNIFYEVFTVCTSIIAEDSKGNLYHGRNLDFGLFMGWDLKNHTWRISESLRPMIINLEFQKNHKTVFKSVNFAGYVGVLTGVKPGVMSLTLNERFTLDAGIMGILKWLIGYRSSKWTGFMTRDALTTAESYAQAKSMLSHDELLAPVYFILGGVNSTEGCVITRSQNKTDDTWEMTKAGGWYILETNYDHWTKPLFIDDRRTPANACMKRLGQKHVSRAGLFNVLSTKPVLNKLTTYTTIMQAETGHVETYVQNCKDPCWPW